MAYKEMKLEPGEARDLYNLWNSGMNGGKKAAPKKKATPAKKSEKKPEKKSKK